LINDIRKFAGSEKRERRNEDLTCICTLPHVLIERKKSEAGGSQ
jgi:hypothetical protein